jgi:hypothetical protein
MIPAGYGPLEYTWKRRSGGVAGRAQSNSTDTVVMPRPVVMTGIVANDPGSRTLTVSRPDQLSGYQRLAWRTAHEALQRSEQSGWRGAPLLWADGAEQSDIAHGVPSDNLTLLFHFPVGKEAYRELVSKPGLSAFVTVNRSTGFFSGVTFRHAPR